MEKPYSELVAQAERSVSGVKDPELRRVAFEKVLDDLLSQAGGKASNEALLKTSRHVGKRAVERASKSRKGGPQAYVEELIAEGFFKKPKTISEVKTELGNRGHHIPLTSLSGPLQTLCQNQKRALRRHKTSGKGKKKTYAYSDW